MRQGKRGNIREPSPMTKINIRSIRLKIGKRGKGSEKAGFGLKENAAGGKGGVVATLRRCKIVAHL